MATLHSPTARCPSCSSARVTMPTGLVKSTIQASGRARRRDGLRDVEHDGHGAQGLRQPAGTRGLLTDAPALERERLVARAGFLATDPQLQQDG